jgi:hypothetical protein
MDIYKAPNYLKMQIKRFREVHQNGTGFGFGVQTETVKVEDFVDFPIENFDLSKYVMNNELPHECLLGSETFPIEIEQPQDH